MSEGFILGFVSNFLAKGVYEFLLRFRYKHLLPHLYTLFTVLDPIIKENLPHLSDEQLYLLVKETAHGLSDGNLAPAEIKRLTKMFFDMFKVSLAAKAEVPVESFDVEDVLGLARKAVGLIK